MAKKGSKQNPINANELLAAIAGADESKNNFEVLSAKIADDFLHYGYKVISGIGTGDVHPGVKGAGIIKDSLRTAFQRLRVHLACIDEVYKTAGIEFSDISSMESDERTGLYTITGFSITGGQDDESVIITGLKYVSIAGGRMELKTPKIPMDNMSSYDYYEDLKESVDRCRDEVSKYKNGNYTAVNTEEEKVKASRKQLKIAESIEAGEPDNGIAEVVDTSDIDADFSNAAL